MSKQRPELLIFDWDGTLMDSVGQIVAAMQAAIADLDLPRRNDAEIADVIGLGLAEAMGRLFPEFDGDEVVELVQRYRRHYRGRRMPVSTLFPEVDRELQTLRENGYTLAVATGKSRAGLDSAWADTGVASFFSVSRCADETASKPDPRMLLEILDLTGLDAGQALMIGDTEYDVEMAVSIGMPALGVACGVHTEARLLDAGALTVLPRVPGLAAWLAATQ